MSADLKYQIPPRVRDVLRNVGLRCGITVQEIRGDKRYPRAVAARIETAHRLNVLGFSQSQIGRWLSKDHSTVFYYLHCEQERTIRKLAAKEATIGQCDEWI